MSIIRRIKAGRPAGASRRPPPVHMATPVICGTCPGNSKANPAERLLDRPRFDQVAALSTLLADELCDTGVNMGPSVASKFFQRWLTAMNMRGKLYPDLIPDGAIGPRTITALKGYLSARGKEGEQVLVRALNCSQGARYLELAEGREANEDFLYGWVKERVL